MGARAMPAGDFTLARTGPRGSADRTSRAFDAAAQGADRRAAAARKAPGLRRGGARRRSPCPSSEGLQVRAASCSASSSPASSRRRCATSSSASARRQRVPDLPDDPTPRRSQAGGDRRRHHGRRHRHVLRQCRHPGDHRRDVSQDALQKGLARCAAITQRTVTARQPVPGGDGQAPALIEPASRSSTARWRGRSGDRGGVRGHGASRRTVFAELDKVARPGALLATNTSTLDHRRDRRAPRRGRRLVIGHAFLQPGERHAAAGDRAGHGNQLDGASPPR